MTWALMTYRKDQPGFVQVIDKHLFTQRGKYLKQESIVTGLHYSQNPAKLPFTQFFFWSHILKALLPA